MKKTALLIGFVLFLALFFCPVVSFAEGYDLNWASDFQEYYDAGFRYFTVSEFQEVINKHPEMATQDASPNKTALEKNSNGLYVVPDDAIKLGADGMKGNDGTTGVNFIVPQKWVTVLSANTNGITSISPVTQNSSMTQNTARSYRVETGQNNSLTGLEAGKRVIVVLNDNSFDFGQVQSWTNGSLTIKANSETDDTAFSYIKQIHYRFTSEDPDWDYQKEFNENLGIVSIGSISTFGHYNINGKVILRGEINAKILVVDLTFVAELDFLNGAEKGIRFDVEDVGESWEKSLLDNIAEFPIIPYIFEIDLSPKIVIEAKGKGAATFRFHVGEGFHVFFGYYPLRKVSVVTSFDEIRIGPDVEDPVVDMQGTAFAGLSWGPGIDVFSGLFVMNLEYQGGVEFTGEKTAVGLVDDNRRYHACKDFECWDLVGKPKLGPVLVKAKAAVPVIRKELWQGTLLNLGGEVYFDPFLKAYFSTTFNTRDTGSCPHKAWNVQVKVADKGARPIKGATVSYSPRPENYDGGYEATTNEDGWAVIYVPYDKAITPPSADQVRITGSLTVGDRTFTNSKVYNAVNMDGEKQYIELEIRQVKVSFKDVPNTNPTQKNMPDPLSYYLVDAKGVVLPQNIPEKSGFQFVSWNTNADASGKSYNPGDYLESDKDVNLYAIYKRLVPDTYVVVYDANGGDSAPMMHSALLGKPVTLSTEPAVWENHHFLGWSYTDESAQVDFPAGASNVLTNPDNKRAITLYAVWSFDPVDPPVKLTYDMNGGPEQQKPTDKWVRRNGWMPISQIIPVWDVLYTFRGWSEDKYSLKGKYAPGDVIRMDESKTLYAIWSYKPAPIPACITFADSGSGTAYGLPPAIFFSPEPETVVQLPDRIPLKSGLHFIGWNTKEDGTGNVYPPGASFSPGGDMTLYAQWKVIHNSYIILYHANGGYSAPSTQIVSLDQAAILTDEPAKWGNHIFLGWAFADDAFEPDYPTGATNLLSNPEGKNIIELYAVWAFSPVGMPVKLSFDMNGGPKANTPSNQFTPRGSCVVITDEAPAWDGQHTFRGWGLNPTDVKPLYQPGDTIVLDDDTKLYALWKVKYTIIQGSGSTWFSDSDSDLRMVADGNIDYFYHLQVDKKPVFRDSDYNLSSGSTIADLYSGLLASLGNGIHEIRFVYDDGAADGHFTVNIVLPKTGDSGHLLLYVSVFFVCIGTLIAIRRKRHQ